MTLQENAVLFVYDIPSKSDLPNPSNQLKRIGIRVNLSCWVIPESRVPYDLIRELDAGGATTEVVRFDESEREKLERLAKNALIAECGRVQKAFETSLATAEMALADDEERYEQRRMMGIPAIGTTPSEDEPTPEDKREKRAKAAMNRAKRSLEAAKECAIAFDLLADVEELIAGTANAVKAEFDVFFAAETQPLVIGI